MGSKTPPTAELKRPLPGPADQLLTQRPGPLGILVPSQADGTQGRHGAESSSFFPKSSSGKTQNRLDTWLPTSAPSPGDGQQGVSPRETAVTL